MHVSEFLFEPILSDHAPILISGRVATYMNQRGSESHLVNTKVYKAKFSVVDFSVNAKNYY